jgi:acyl-CoA synthetase (AMP-forming)/AMP-acid ligase II
MRAEKTLAESLSHWAASTPDRIALTATDLELSFGRLSRVVDVAALNLRRRGVGLGDRVVVVGHNTWQWVVAYLAILRLSAIAVPLNNRLSARQVGDLMRLLDPKLVATDDAHLPIFSTIEHLSVVSLDGEESSAWLSTTDAHATLPLMPIAERPAIISFTSGTTGTPKGAVLCQSALGASSRIIAEEIGLSATSSTLILAPLFHNIGFVDQLGALLYAGGRSDLLREFHTKDAIAALKRRPVTYITAVPSVLRLLMVAEEAEAVFASARTVLFGGSPMPAPWSTELLTRWPHLELRHGYGLTEFGSACAIRPARFIASHGDSVGYPPPEVQLRLVGGDGNDVSAGDVGEIWASGPSRMSEYWKQPEATAEKLAGPWLRTGDLAKRGEHDLIYIVGRRDDTINRGGEKILPQFVESALAECPEVAQCVVFGVPHPIFQQAVTAAVEVRPGRTFDPKAARDHLRARLPDYAIPADFWVHATLPRTGSGKIDRRASRALYIARNEAQGK